MTELLAPAGNLEKLEWAAAYGADAVYFGIKNFSLRSFAGNFTIDEAEQGLKLLHSQSKKGYVTLNIYPYTNEYTSLIETAKNLESLNVDAFIVADLGVIMELQKHNIKTPIHISTQANTLSYQTVSAYKTLGASRVNLARELSLEQIKQISEHAQKIKIQTEVFIHGAVCFSYSGRCAISDYLTGRKANRGECTHPCRWKYFLTEEKREGQYMPVVEDDRGLYFFNSKELALYNYINDLISAGIDSLKIEGRMKSIHYISTVVSFYKNILKGKNYDAETAKKLLGRINNRGYSEGFIKGNINSDDYLPDGNTPSANSIFVANTEKTDLQQGTLLRVRNKMIAGSSLELLSPNGELSTIILPDILKRIDGTNTDIAQNCDHIIIDQKLPEYSILRILK